MMKVSLIENGNLSIGLSKKTPEKTKEGTFDSTDVVSETERSRRSDSRTYTVFTNRNKHTVCESVKGIKRIKKDKNIREQTPKESVCKKSPLFGNKKTKTKKFKKLH
jgi:hypothetical protein